MAGFCSFSDCMLTWITKHYYKLLKKLCCGGHKTKITKIKAQNKSTFKKFPKDNTRIQLKNYELLTVKEEDHE